MDVRAFALRVMHLPDFRASYEAILACSARREFETLQAAGTEPAPNWPYTLLCASVLTRIEDQQAQDAALRIAQTCLQTDGVDAAERYAAGLLLERMSNFPAVELARNRKLLPDVQSWAAPLANGIEAAVRRRRRTVRFATGEDCLLNSFQQEFLTAVQRATRISVTAPTSAGKSFVLRKWLETAALQTPDARIVYLAPTRALVHEVEQSLRSSLKGSRGRPEIMTVPSAVRDSTARRQILVLTQERYQILLSRIAPDFVPTVVVVDEAQKISDGTRGVLLQHVLDETGRRAPLAHVVFASPFVANPEVLHEAAPSNASTATVRSSLATVNQNLLWASPRSQKPQLWDVSLVSGNDVKPLGAVELRARPDTIAKRIAYVAWGLSQTKRGNLVYVNTASEAETVTVLLAQLMGESDVDERSTELDALAELADAAVHKKFSLGAAVRQGVGFHYGSMPLLLRIEVERCFKEGHLRYLVCTSTLVEGVNLPCRTLYVRAPRRGQNNPMTMADFWNLAGRAGRWGSEFQGNIVCIDPMNPDWKNGAPREPVRAVIQTTSARVAESTPALARLVAAESTEADASKRADLEALLSYVFARLRRDPSSDLLGENVPEQADKVRAFIRDTLHGPIPVEVIERNPGVSLQGMARLLEYFESSKKAVADVAPIAAASAEALGVYVRILGRINKYLAPGVFGIDKHVFGCSLLTVNWIRGWSLPRLIDSYHNRKNAPPNSSWPADIRYVMKHVEEVARFLVPKLVACYVDVLMVYTQRIRLSAEDEAGLDAIPQDLQELLEFGVAERTQLSLMNLGLTRTTVVALFGLMVKPDMTSAECLRWLEERDLDQLGLPVLVVREIRRMLELRAAEPST